VEFISPIIYGGQAVVLNFFENSASAHHHIEKGKWRKMNRAKSKGWNMLEEMQAARLGSDKARILLAALTDMEHNPTYTAEDLLGISLVAATISCNQDNNEILRMIAVKIVRFVNAPGSSDFLVRFTDEQHEKNHEIRLAASKAIELMSAGSPTSTV
jgi:hypothetical protein